MVNKLRIKNNVRGQFQIGMTAAEGTINCVVSVPMEPPSQQAVHRRLTALELAKVLVRRLDEEIRNGTAMRSASEHAGSTLIVAGQPARMHAGEAQ
jgi:polysaccharide deacetylase 2 family uncharacterized protein YibQ